MLLMQAVSAVAPAVVSTGNWLVDKSYGAFNRVKGGIVKSPQVGHQSPHPAPHPAAEDLHEEIEREVRRLRHQRMSKHAKYPLTFLKNVIGFQIVGEISIEPHGIPHSSKESFQWSIFFFLHYLVWYLMLTRPVIVRSNLVWFSATVCNYAIYLI